MSHENDTPQHDDEATKRKFRKKPLEVEAMQWDGTNADELSTWTDGAFNSSPCGNTEDHSALVTACLYVDANVQHLGIVTGEWIIADQAGFYPCKPDIFEATYDAVELGVTKGLPGLAAEAGIGALNRLVAGLAPEVPPLPSKAEGGFQHAGQEAGKNIAGALEQIAPGSSDAASIGVQLGLNPDLPNAPQWVKQLLGQHDPLAAALDLIGRRTDIVAVKLPEPTAPDFTGVEWSDKAAGWDVFAYGSTEHRGKVQVRIPEFVAPADARNAAAALYAAAARVDAAEGEAK